MQLAGAIIYYKTITGFESGSGTLYAKANQAVSDAFSSIRVVQAYNLQSYVCRLYQKLLGSADETMGKRSLVVGGLMSYSQFSTFAVYGLIIWFGGLEVYAGRSNFDDMLKAFLAILISALGIAQAQIGFPDAGKAKAAVQVIFPIIDRKPLINAADESGERPEAMRGEIELQVRVHACMGAVCVLVGGGGAAFCLLLNRKHGHAWKGPLSVLALGHKQALGFSGRPLGHLGQQHWP